MTATSRSITLFLLALALAVSVVALPGSSPAEARRLLDRGSSDNSAWASYMTQNIVDSKTVGYTDSVQNNRNYAITASCTASTQKTVTWSVGGSVSGEIKAGIFGGVKTEVNGSVARSMSTGFSTSANFRVPARDTVNCDRGTVNERIKGFTKLSYCGGGCRTERRNWSFKAPERLRWWIY